MQRPMNVPVRMQASDRRGARASRGSVTTMPSDRRRGAGGEAGRQVDLAEQQHEHQAHRDDDDAGGLVDQVREVELALVNVSPRSEVNTTTSTIRPRTAGSEPTSPPRTLVT